MAEYNLVETILVKAKTVKHRVMMFIDAVIPHIFIRKSLFEYKPREIKTMMVEDLIRALEGRGRVRIVFEEDRRC